MKTEHRNPNRHSRTSLFNGFFEGQASLRIAASGNESGRSMVEMLGVLAVMGILTIGGIAGFNYAMDKSKANDILDGVNKRAIALSSYLMLGTNISATTLDAEFSNHIGDAAVALSPVGAGFKMTVSGLTDSVCDQVLTNGLKMASEITLGEAKIWNKGVKSDHTCADSDNTISFSFNAALNGTLSATEATPAGPKGGECTETCSGGATCVNGYCECPKGTMWNPRDDLGNGWCIQATSGECMRNSDCENSDQYCEIHTSDCDMEAYGKCVSLTNGIETIYNGKTFLLAQSRLSWWSGRNWCQAHGKRMIGLDDINCSVANGCSDLSGLGASFIWVNNPYGMCDSYMVYMNKAIYEERHYNYSVICK